MSMTEQEFSDEISAVIEAKMSVPWQVASIASQWWKRADETSENDPISRRHAMTLRQCATELAEHLATPQPPKPAGDVPLPMFPIESDGSYWSTTEIEVIRAYGNAREAAARDAGRADAVPAWVGKLPAPISNPEAWPANYAGGYNDALAMCYDVIRGHAPQPMTTQGKAGGVPEGWQVKAAAWLEGKAVEQEENNKRWPEHAAAYKEWRDRPLVLRMLAQDIATPDEPLTTIKRNCQPPSWMFPDDEPAPQPKDAP